MGKANRWPDLSLDHECVRYLLDILTDLCLFIIRAPLRTWMRWLDWANLIEIAWRRSPGWDHLEAIALLQSLGLDHLRDIASATGCSRISGSWKHLGGSWETSERHLGGIWEASGRPRWPWEVRGGLRGKGCQSICVLPSKVARSSVSRRRDESDLHKPL